MLKAQQSRDEKKTNIRVTIQQKKVYLWDASYDGGNKVYRFLAKWFSEDGGLLNPKIVGYTPLLFFVRFSSCTPVK